MVVFDSIKGFFDVVVSPFREFFTTFPEFRNIIYGIIVLSLGYFGWRAVK